MAVIIHGILFGIAIPVLISGIILLIPRILQLFGLVSQQHTQSTVISTAQPTTTPSISQSQSQKTEPFKQHRTSHQWLWVGGLAITLGYAAGYIGLLGMPNFPGREALQWLFWMTPLAIFIGWLKQRDVFPSVVLWLAYAVLLAATQWLMFKPLIQHGTWATALGLLYLLNLSLVGLLYWAILQSLLRYWSDSYLAWALMLYTVGTSLLLALSGSAKLAQLGGVLVSILGIWWVLSLAVQKFGWKLYFGHSIIPVFVLLHTGLSYNGYIYAQLSTVSLIILGIIPPLLWLTSRTISHRNPIIRLAISSSLIILPIAIAIAIIQFNTPAASEYY